MPELPEVETTRRGIQPFVEGQRIVSLRVHNARLRWPVPPELPELLANQRVARISRRGKYLLFHIDTGVMMVHLGMSGSLRLVTLGTPRKTHDHLEWTLDNNWLMRYHDPRLRRNRCWSSNSACSGSGPSDASKGCVSGSSRSHRQQPKRRGSW